MTSTAKITLIAPETFFLDVKVPTLGGGEVAARFEMKARRKSEFDEWLKGVDSMSNREFVGSIVVGWDLAEPFTAENLATLLDVHPLAANAIGIAYVGEYNRVVSGG